MKVLVISDIHANIRALDTILREEDVYKRQIYYYVNLQQIKDVAARMAFIHENLLFTDWWHTDQIIRYVAALDFEMAIGYAQEYICLLYTSRCV